MDRRDFMKSAAVAGAAAVVGSSAFSFSSPPISTFPRRPVGKTGEEVSIIGFGGIIVTNQTPEEAAQYVSEAFDLGINYFDVAPGYGDAQEKLGPALKPYRNQCFLACKTAQRDAANAQNELEASLKLLQTDRFDLYQLHGLSGMEDVDKAFASGGAMETLVKAKESGKVRFLGFSAHDEAAALAAMDLYPFDTILFPLNFIAWNKGQFGPKVLKRANEKEMGVFAIKSMARARWSEQGPAENNQWPKCWYEPFEDPNKISLGLRFTLGLSGVSAAVPPGYWDLFKKALAIVNSGMIQTPLSESEQEAMRQIANEIQTPIFEAQV